jgi:C-terminal processing protease CtpA/Prc
VDLGNGVTVFLPSWKALRPDGSCFEGQGIAPDLSVSATTTELKTADPVLQAALALLAVP